MPELQRLCAEGLRGTKPRHQQSGDNCQNLKKGLHTILPLAFRMALDTQIIGGFKRHHRGFVSGATGLVAAQTLHGQVFIAGINHLFTNRMGGMGFPFVTFAAKIPGDILLGNQQDIVCGMGVVTAAAIARLYRLAQPLLVFGIVD